MINIDHNVLIAHEKTKAKSQERRTKMKGRGTVRSSIICARHSSNDVCRSCMSMLCACVAPRLGFVQMAIKKQKVITAYIRDEGGAVLFGLLGSLLANRLLVPLQPLRVDRMLLLVLLLQ